jgi:hypothetical protein
MIQKRAFADDNSYEVACKHPRQMEHIDQFAPIFPLDNAHQKHLVSGNGLLVVSVTFEYSLYLEPSYNADCGVNYFWVSFPIHLACPIWWLVTEKDLMDEILAFIGCRFWIINHYTIDFVRVYWWIFHDDCCYMLAMVLIILGNKFILDLICHFFCILEVYKFTNSLEDAYILVLQII